MDETQIAKNEREQKAAEYAGEGSLWSYDRYTETRQQRAKRLARKKVNPETAAALARLWRK